MWLKREQLKTRGDKKASEGTMDNSPGPFLERGISIHREVSKVLDQALVQNTE